MLHVHALSQFPTQIVADVELDIRVLSGVMEVVDGMQFVAIFGGIACQLATIAKVAKVIGGFVLIFPQRDVVNVI
jgi:hypothetical protein